MKEQITLQSYMKARYTSLEVMMGKRGIAIFINAISRKVLINGEKLLETVLYRLIGLDIQLLYMSTQCLCLGDGMDMIHLMISINTVLVRIII
jgi:hypothetical protein